MDAGIAARGSAFALASSEERTYGVGIYGVEPAFEPQVSNIPGLIEGAHEGAGLGIQFLRHVERCPVLVQLVDLSAEEDLAARVDTIRTELEAHEAPLEERPWVLVGTMLATWIGTGSIFGNAEKVYQVGLAALKAVLEPEADDFAEALESLRTDEGAGAEAGGPVETPEGIEDLDQ